MLSGTSTWVACLNCLIAMCSRQFIFCWLWKVLLFFWWKLWWFCCIRSKFTRFSGLLCLCCMCFRGDAVQWNLCLVFFLKILEGRLLTFGLSSLVFSTHLHSSLALSCICSRLHFLLTVATISCRCLLHLLIQVWCGTCLKIIDLWHIYEVSEVSCIHQLVRRKTSQKPLDRLPW